MKALIICAITILASTVDVFAQSPAVKKLDEKAGFRTATLGQQPEQLLGAKLLNEKGALKTYIKGDEPLKIGAAAIYQVQYVFYKSRLAKIVVLTQGQENSQQVFDAFVAEYGPGYESSRQPGRFSWDGQKVSMTILRSRSSGDSIVEISSKALDDEMLADSFKQAEKAGKSDL